MLFAFVMGWPANGKTVIKSLPKGTAGFEKEVGKVELLGAGLVTFVQDENGLTVNMPEKKPNDLAYTLKISPK